MSKAKSSDITTLEKPANVEQVTESTKERKIETKLQFVRVNSKASYLDNMERVAIWALKALLTERQNTGLKDAELYSSVQRIEQTVKQHAKTIGGETCRVKTSDLRDVIVRAISPLM